MVYSSSMGKICTKYILSLYSSSMGKICTKYILRLLWKMVENMFFLDSEHVGMGGMLPQEKGCFFAYVICLVSKHYFIRWCFFVAAIFRHVAKFYI